MDQHHTSSWVRGVKHMISESSEYWLGSSKDSISLKEGIITLVTIEPIQFQGWEGKSSTLNSLGILYQMGELCLWNKSPPRIHANIHFQVRRWIFLGTCPSLPLLGKAVCTGIFFFVLNALFLLSPHGLTTRGPTWRYLNFIITWQLPSCPSSITELLRRR